MDLYEKFVLQYPDSNFFQSWVFGEFQESLPYRGKSWALLTQPTTGNQQLTTGTQASCLVIKIKLLMNFCWLWVPYGPLLTQQTTDNKQLTTTVFEDLERIAKEERAIFARIEPPLTLQTTDNKQLTTVALHKIIPSPTRYTPEHTLILDLEKSEDEILAQMKPKGRYNIQVAKKHGVAIERIPGADVDENILNNFYEILRKTGDRDEFGIHPKYFYKNLLEIFGRNKMADLFLAKTPDGKIIAGIIAVYYKDTATYYYGASDYEHRNLMAPYLLQWEAILEARCRGMKHYDFLGVAPEGAKENHPWAGVTEFKKKFGGKEVIYPKAFDIIYKPVLYNLMKIAKRFL